MLDSMYTLIYPEQSEYQKSLSWTIRQTGVFHRVDTSTNTNFWMIMSPMANSKLHQMLSTAVQEFSWHKLHAFNWDNLHSEILSCYIGNWRWYLNHLSDNISSSVGDVWNRRRTMEVDDL